MGLSWLMPVDPASVSGTGKVFVIVDGFCKVSIQYYRFSVKLCYAYQDCIYLIKIQ